MVKVNVGLIAINILAVVTLVASVALPKDRMRDKREEPAAVVWHCKMLCRAECSWAGPNLEYCNQRCIDSKASGYMHFNAKFNCDDHGSFSNSVFF